MTQHRVSPPGRNAREQTRMNVSLWLYCTSEKVLDASRNRERGDKSVHHGQTGSRVSGVRDSSQSATQWPGDVLSVAPSAKEDVFMMVCGQSFVGLEESDEDAV